MEIILPKGLTCRSGGQLFQHKQDNDTRSQSPAMSRQSVSMYQGLCKAHMGLHYYYFTQQEAGQMEKGIF